jgi:hypothetical protein
MAVPQVQAGNIEVISGMIRKMIGDAHFFYEL